MSYQALWRVANLQRVVDKLAVSHWMVTEYIDSESGGWNISPTSLCALMSQGRRVVQLTRAARVEHTSPPCERCEMMLRFIRDKSV